MNIKIDIAQLMLILERTPADQNIMLSGRHGIGKSEILTEYYEGKGMKVVTLFLGQMSDPGDLIGLPDKRGERTEFLPPYWFPLDSTPVVLFLDELNRARPEVLQTIMDLSLHRRLAGRDLPPGSRVIAAVNEGEEYQLTDLDPALVSRFNVYRFEPTAEEWLVWAAKHELDPRVIDFIKGNKDWLDRDPGQKVSAETGMDKQPDRRAWKRVSDIIKGVDYLDMEYRTQIAGVVGIRATHKFITELKSNHRLSARDFLRDYGKHITAVMRWPLHEQAILNEGIMQYLEVDGNKCAPEVATNLSKYIEHLSACQRGEVLASFASCITSNHFPAALRFIAKNCPGVMPLLMKHISHFDNNN